MRIRRPCVNHKEAEGRCGRAERDRPANCRDVLVSDAKCRRDSPAVGGTRFSRDARPCPATIAPTAKRLDGQQEARLIATRLGSPPQGYASGSLRLLARKVVELKIVESVSRETVRRTLKKAA